MFAPALRVGGGALDARVLGAMGGELRAVLRGIDRRRLSGFGRAFKSRNTPWARMLARP